MKKRILTLALALATVAALAVTAMAEEDPAPPSNIDWVKHESTDLCADTHGTIEYDKDDATCTEDGSEVWTCETCHGTKTKVLTKLGHQAGTEWVKTDATHHWKVCVREGCTTEDEQLSKAEHTWTYSAGTNDGTHKKTCSVCGYSEDNIAHDHSENKFDATNHWTQCVCGDKSGVTAHTDTIAHKNDPTHHWDECTATGCDYATEKVKHTVTTWTQKNADGHAGTCTGCEYDIPANTPHDFDDTGKCTLCKYKNVKDPVAIAPLLDIEMNAGKTKTIDYLATDEDDNVTTSDKNITFHSSNTAVASVSTEGVITAKNAGTATITIKIDGSEAASFEVTVKHVENLYATVSESVGVFNFGSTETDSGYSIYDLIVSGFSATELSSINSYTLTLAGHTTTANKAIATISGYTSGMKLVNLDKVNLSIVKSGTWSVDYTVKDGSDVIMSGTLSITIEAYTGADIIYSAALGESVELDISDFDEFWSEVIGNYYGSVTYVRFNSITGLNGTLCYEHVANETRHTNAIGNSFYVNPTRNQKALADLTFVPTKSGTKYITGTATINFTVYGTNRNNTTTSANGSIVITYTNGEVQPIVYDSVSGVVYFDASDFNAVYKAATNSTSTNPSYTIKFLDVPTYGTLYRSYKLNSHGNNTGTALTEKNIGNYTFSNRTTGDNSITNVAYVPLASSAIGDSVRYAVYSGNTLLYIGTVTFNSEKVVVSYTTTSNGVRFNAYDFYNTSSAILSAQYLSFGTPSSGTLYKNYNGTSGAVVTKNEYFGLTTEYGVTSLNSITYVPRANYTGVVEIPFTASSLTGVTFSGTVKVYVVAKPFADVNPSAWSAPYINRLYASGVVGGTSATTFSPKANMKYGEALKMILLAAGYPKQAETGGNHWATNYLTLAYRNGIVSSTNIDLNALVDRNTIAEITAKALGLSKATRVDAGIIGPSDSSNGYVLALYNAGIVGGEFHGNTNYFYGSRNITREEVAKIICTVMDYKAK